MKKVISIMLTVVMLFSMAFSTAVFAGDETATVTYETLDAEIQCGYDGIAYSLWTNSSSSYGYKNYSDLVMDGRAFDWTTEGDVTTATKGYKNLYVRFKLSDLTNTNITSARMLFSHPAGLSNCPMNIYKFSNSIWDSTKTTAPIVDRTTPTVSFNTGAREAITENVDSTWVYYAEADLSDVVKAAVEDEEEYLCLVFGPSSSSYGTIYNGDTNKIRLQVFTEPLVPEVSLYADKEAYEAGDDVVITATTANVAQDATVSYTFTVNDEAKAGVDNVLTIADAEEGEYEIKVTCNDGTNTFEDTITVIVTESGPVITANTLTGDYLNGYDGKKFSEWTNNVGGYTNTSNFVLDGRTASKKSVYMKFKVDDYKTSNISGARLLISYNGNFDNATMNVYAFDESLWNTETAPTVDRTTKTVEFRTPAKVDGSRVLLSDEYIESGWEYFAYVDLSDAVKTAIVNDQEYFCLVLEPNGTPYGTFYISEVAKPRLQIMTSSNNIPTATISANPDKASYLTTDTVTVTANGQDADADATLTYTFYVNDVEVTDGVDGNVLTLSNLEAGNNVVKVKVTDQWGDYGVATKTIFVKGTPEKTYNTVSDYTFYNSYEGKVFTEYNNVVNHNQQYNYILNGDTNKLILFTKFKVSDFANTNISSARLLTSMGGGLKGKTIKIYKFDADLWSDTVGPVIDRSESNVVDTVVLPSDAYTAITDNLGTNWSYNTQFDVTSAIKDAIANGDEYVCMTIENASAGYSTFGLASENRPRLQVVTTTNNIPTVLVKADKLTYNEGDNVVLTAVGSDKDVDSSLTYKFYVDGVEATEGVNGNKLTISNYDGLEHAVTVKCFDEWNDYGVATITVKKNMAFEISVDVSGSIATTLSASYTVKNMDTVNPIDATVIIAVYDASGALYDTQFATSQVGAGATATLGATLTPKTLPEGETFEGYTAQAMIWTSKTLIPLWECVDFE